MNNNRPDCDKCGVAFDLYDADNSYCVECVKDDPVYTIIIERDRYKAEAEYERRRRVAAEELLHECRGCDKQSPLTCNECAYWKAWQLIKYPSVKDVKEAGE